MPTIGRITSLIGMTDSIEFSGLFASAIPGEIGIWKGQAPTLTFIKGS